MANSPVTGLGGAFLFSDDTDKLAHWYTRHLGIDFMSGEEHGKTMYFKPFLFREHASPETQANAVFAIRPRTDQQPGSNFMVNLRTTGLQALVEKLKAEGVTVEDLEHHEGQGWFAHVRDADNNLVELWEDGFTYPQG